MTKHIFEAGSAWTYKPLESDPSRFAVGFHDPCGNWHQTSEHDTEDAARDFVDLLNHTERRAAEISELMES